MINSDWLKLMQSVAGQFAGRDTSSAEVAEAWREAVQRQGEPWAQWMPGMAAGPIGGADPGLKQAADWWQNWQREAAPWLEMPGLGLGRNQHQRWQTLARAQQEYQQQLQAHAELLKAVMEQAFKRFEQRLAEHEQEGAQLNSARAMFDLWIEAAEEAYASAALSPEFREASGAFANAHMRLRAALQQEVEQAAERLGMPTRTEMDAAHRRITELERQVRQLLRASQAPSTQTAAAKKPASKKSAVKKAVSKKPAAKKPASKKSTAKKSARSHKETSA